MESGNRFTVDSNSSIGISGTAHIDFEAEPRGINYDFVHPDGMAISGAFQLPEFENMELNSIMDDIQGFNPHTFDEWMERMANVQPMDIPFDAVDRLFNPRNTWVTRVVPDREMTEEEAYFDRLGVDYEMDGTEE
jgi:hypothetical protein